MPGYILAMSLSIPAMARLPRKRDLTFYLLKSEVTDFSEALSNTEGLDCFEIPANLGFGGRIYTRAPRSSPPWWLGFLRGATPGIQDMLNSSTAALLFLEIDGHKFALKLPLICLQPDTLRSVDARTFEELSVAKKTQTSRPAGLEIFGLNRSEEILKAVTGTPADGLLAHRITGADAAKLTYAPDLLRLPDKCRQLIAVHQSDHYKTRYDFIDYMREVRDGALLSRLDGILVHRLQSRDFDALHMAPPDASDWVEIEGFVFSRAEDDSREDLDPANYVETFAAAEEITLQRLRRDQVGVVYATSNEPNYRWRVYDTIVCEVLDTASLYVLTGGSWYRIEPTFADQVMSAVAARTTDVNFLPPSIANEKEGVYNQRASATAGLHLFDEKLVRPDGAASDMEFCDLITIDRCMVHVKRKSRSSTLSHLFAQGVMSAETFYSDRGFRERLKAKASAEISTAAAEIIPHERPLPSNWTVLFAIIATTQREWPRSLPFFSQLNFRNAADRLARFGFNVGLVRIPITGNGGNGSS